MKKRIHLTKTEIALLLLTILFAVSMLLYKVSRVQKGDWQITTEREDRQQQEIVPVNINTATEEELIAVEGIGPALARRIIAYREENGPFQTIDELDNVKGIGPSLIENIRYLVFLFVDIYFFLDLFF